MMDIDNKPEFKWSRIYIFILAFNALLVVLFYLIRLYFNSF